MVEIGKLNKLTVLRKNESGAFLDGGDDGDILLPSRYLPTKEVSACEVGDTVEVFIFFDTNDRLMATTEIPKATVGEYALLKVVSVERVGAFLDWGLPKDLFLPFAEQIDDLKVGEDVVVFLYLDKTDRISASMRLNRNKEKFPIDFKEGDSVDLVIARRTDLGYQAIINKRHMGMVFNNEVFQELHYGQQLKGFIRKIREDGKIDLSLQTGVTGHKAAAGVDQKILDLLNAKDGFLPIHNKTPPEAIYGLFGVSKKLFKIALSDLYKKRIITIDEDGIRLVKKV